MSNKGQYRNYYRISDLPTSAAETTMVPARRNTGGIVADTGGGDNKPAVDVNTLLPKGMKKSDWILIGGAGLVVAVGLLILFRRRS